MKVLATQCTKLMAGAVEIDVVKTEKSLVKKRFEKLDANKLQKDLVDAKTKLALVVIELYQKKRDIKKCAD